MFSSRFHWDLHPNRLSRRLAEKRAAGATILDLTESNPTHAGLDYPAVEIAEALADPRMVSYDPHPAGMRPAREAVAAYYAARGQRVEPERVLLTASTSEAYAYLFKLLCNPGDDVLAPRPSYPLFEFLGAMENVVVHQYPLVYHGEWTIDLDALSRAIHDRTRAIVVVNPNNPTGSFVKSDEVGALVRLCARHKLALISDEVFSDYCFGPDPRCVERLIGIEGALAFSMSGLSKISGLPQMKLGWIVVSGPAELRAEALEKLELIADTYLSVATPVQLAAAKLIEIGAHVQQQIAERTRQNWNFLNALLGKHSPCTLLDLEGGWYATLQVPRTRREEEWALELLAEDDVLVQPGFFYDFASEAFLVLSLLTPPKTFREGARRILARAET